MKKSGFSLFFAIFLSLFLLLGASAEQVPTRVIRVAQPEIDNFFVPQSDGTMSGYGGEYLAKLSEYTGWRFEFVPGNWSDCLKWLEDGEIDLIFSAEYSAERGQKYLYSDVECAINFVGLLCRADNKSFFYEDYAAFDGMTVGMVEGNFLNAGFEQFAQTHHFSYTPHYYSSQRVMNAALAARQVDAVVNGNFNVAANQKLLAKFDYMPSYFITSHDQQDLMNQLDIALYQIELDSPNFLMALTDKYFSAASRPVKSITREESEFIAQNGTFTVLCDSYNYPFEWYNAETGRFEGVNIDLLNQISHISGLTFEYKNVGDFSAAWQAIHDKKGDIISGVHGNSKLSLQYELDFTKSYITETKVFVGHSMSVLNPSEPLTIASRSSQIGILSYLEEIHPEWNILTSKNISDCLLLVTEEKADAAFVSALALQTTPMLVDFPSLSIVPTMNVAVPISLGVRQGADPRLLQILNKAILQLTDEDIEQATVRNSIARMKSATLSSMFRSSQTLRTGTVIVIFSALFIGFFIFYRNYVHSRQAELLQAKNEELQEAIALAQHANRAREQYDQLYNTAVCGILQVACDPGAELFRLINSNREAARLTGLTPNLSNDELLGQLHHLLSDTARASLWAMCRAMDQVGDKYPLDLALSCTADHELWISGTIELISLHSKEKILQATFMDSTRHKLQEDKLRVQSETDLLTGLLNKSAAERLFREYLTSDKLPCAFFVIDIDDFKGINDHYGHQRGDDLLRQVGQCLSTLFRSGDIAGRVGGDEFAVLLRGAEDEGGICRRAKRVCDAIQSIQLSAPHPIELSCSLGISRFPIDATDYDGLFAAADRALYHAKRTAKGHYVLYHKDLLSFS